MKKKIVPGAEKQTKDHSVLAKKTRKPRNMKKTVKVKVSTLLMKRKALKRFVQIRQRKHFNIIQKGKIKGASMMIG